MLVYASVSMSPRLPCAFTFINLRMIESKHLNNVNDEEIKMLMILFIICQLNKFLERSTWYNRNSETCQETKR